TADIKRDLPISAPGTEKVRRQCVPSRGPTGGGLGHLYPAAELPMLAVLLDARIGIRSPRGRRVADAGRFFTGSLTTDLKADEIVTDVEVQHLSPAAGGGFEEVARRARGFPLAPRGGPVVGVTMLAREGTADRVRIGLMGVGDTPVRAPEAEGLLAGRAIDAEALERAGAVIEAAVKPNSDLHASADYRRFLAGALARRAI